MSRILLIPAAGEGSRFRSAGLNVAKPLLQVNGRTLLEHTLDSFPLEQGDLLLLAVQRRHGVRQALASRLTALHPTVDIHWLELDALLPGQLATSAAAIRQLLQRQPSQAERQLLIHNCDTGFQWSSDLNVIEGFASMAVFPASGNHWSFGQPDPLDPNLAIAIAEKQRISDLASIGLYGFRSTAAFLAAAEQQLASGRTVNGEHYIAPMLQAALERGDIVSLPRVSGVRLYGTPSELCASFAISLHTLLSDNQQPLNAT